MMEFREGRRQSFRVSYPPDHCPKLVLGNTSYSIAEISLTGIVFACQRPTAFPEESRHIGAIKFLNGTQLAIDGRVVRQMGSSIALRLLQPVPEAIFAQEVEEHTSPQDRRRYFRLRYPITLSPSCQLGEKQYPVVEISEYGLVLFCLDPHAFLPRQHIRCVIRYHDGKDDIAEGTILRMRNGEVVILLSAPISEQRVFSEQRYILQESRGHSRP